MKKHCLRPTTAFLVVVLANASGMVFAQSNTTFKPFIKITRWSPASATVGLQNSSLTFTAQVLASPGCAGTVEIAAGLATPTGAIIQWTAPDQGNTVVMEHSFKGDDSFAYEYTATTDSKNMVSGEGTATAYITSYPAMCQIIGDNQTVKFRITSP